MKTQKTVGPVGFFVFTKPLTVERALRIPWIGCQCKRSSMAMGGQVWEWLGFGPLCFKRKDVVLHTLVGFDSGLMFTLAANDLFCRLLDASWCFYMSKTALDPSILVGFFKSLYLLSPNVRLSLWSLVICFPKSCIMDCLLNWSRRADFEPWSWQHKHKAGDGKQETARVFGFST